MTHPEVLAASPGVEGEILSRNLEALRKHNAKLADDLARIDPDTEDPDFPGWHFDVRAARNGQPTMVAVNGEGEVAMHSTYDPEREAADQVGRVLDGNKRNFFVILGFGLGYAVEKVAAEADSDNRIFAVEPHIASFRKALSTRDLSGVLADPRLVVALGPKLDNAIAAFLGIYNLADCTGVGFIESAGRSRLPGAEFFSKYLERLKGVLITTGGNLQTLMLMAWTYQRNTMASLSHVVNSPPVRTLFDAFKNKPAIIVSAGPSLEKNIDQLADLKDKAVIIGVDTSLRPLLNAGIEPHLICTGDPQEANWKHLRSTETTDAHLIAEPMTFPMSIEYFRDRLFIASYGDKVMNWLARFIPDVGHTLCWGSVATMAFDVARKMSCDPIIFVGQDLSFPGGRTYVKGTYFEDEDKQDMSVENFEKKHRTYTLDDIHGNPVKTNRQMFAYKEWFRVEFGRTSARIINATEGGILKENCEIMTLRDASRLLDEKFDATAGIRAAAESFDGYELEKLRRGLKENIESIRRCEKICDKGIELVKDGVRALEGLDKLSPVWCAKLIAKLDELRFKLMSEQALNDFLGTANQIGVLNFKRAYKKLHGKDFSRLVFRQALDLFTDLFMSTGRTARGVLPFFVLGLKKLEDAESILEEKVARR
jgi:hypothetical protein